MTTAAGLSVAIPALLIYHYFQGRLDRVQDLVEETASEFLHHYYGTSGVARRKGLGSANDADRSVSSVTEPTHDVVSTHERSRTGS